MGIFYTEMEFEMLEFYFYDDDEKDIDDDDNVDNPHHYNDYEISR